MCGFAVVLKGLDDGLPLRTVEAMAALVAHRGPDGAASVGLGGCEPLRNPDASRWSVGMAHRRLAIIDLSSAGAQPMEYAGRYWMVYNGEVFNYIELRALLTARGRAFRSQTDSEVILASYAEWGRECFARFRGMWALVLFDRERNEVVLSRDRLGIKPLYVWRNGDRVAIASEIKEFTAFPGFRARMNEEAAWEYLQTGYEDPSRSFFGDVLPVTPGTTLHVSLPALEVSRPVGYWSPEATSVSVTDPREASDRFAAKLEECVRIHIRSDVPVGSSLSGGLDSSALTLLLEALSGRRDDPVPTFTSTFPGDPVDEREHVDVVLRCGRLAPHFVTASPQRFLEELDDFVWHHDEPVGSLSVYAAFCLARTAREAGVPVILNGQGGDELLSGYWQFYFLYLRELVLRGNFLAVAKHLCGALWSGGNPALVQQIPVMFRRYRARRRATFSPFTDSAGQEQVILKRMLSVGGQERRLAEIRTMFLPRLLKWDDRNSMAFSVEGRYPFLDHELIELALSFSSEVLFNRGWTKLPLRRGLAALPREIATRKSKIGFEVPQNRWLCGPLRPVFEKWLASDRPIWDHVDRDQTRRLARETWHVRGQREEPGQTLFRCFALDRWLETFAVS